MLSRLNPAAEPLTGSTLGLPFAAGLYFALRVILVVLSVRLLGTDPQTGAAINLGLNFAFLVLAAFCSAGAARLPFVRMARLASLRWAILFLAVSGCSLAWTASTSLSAAAAYWCALVADAAIVILLFRAGPLIDAAHSLMKGFVWGACAVALIAWIMPAQSDLRLGDEELLGPNQIGYLCAFACFFAQYLTLKKDGRWNAPAIVLALTALRSLSKTTIVAFIAGEAFILARDRQMSRRAKAWLTIATIVIFAAFSSLFASYYDIYSRSGNQPETLTGRLGIWAYFLEESLQQPWIGHGFHSVWKVVPPFDSDRFEARHAHNELLQQFYAYGLLGIALFAGIYASFYLHIRRLAPGRMRTFLFAFLIFCLVRGLADTESFDLSLPLWTLIMMTLLIEHEREVQPVPAAVPRQPMAAPATPLMANE
jgi:O-antigen ligase